MSSINPNSRAPFTDNNGRLTKYGIDIIKALYDALNLTAESNDLSDLYAALDNDTTSSRLRAQIVHLQRRVDALEACNEIENIKGRLKFAENKILELDTDCADSHYKTLLNKIKEIEAQL